MPLFVALGIGLVALALLAYWSQSLRVRVQRQTRELREAVDRQAFQGHVLAQVADAIVVIGAEGKVESWNPGAETLFGRRAVDVLGKDVAEVVTHKVVTLRDDDRLREAIQGGSTWKGDAQIIRPSGDTVFVELVVRAIVDPEGQTSGSLIVAHDVDARRAAELEGRVRWRQQAAVAALGQRALAGVDFDWLMDQAVSVTADTLQVATSGIFAIDETGDTLMLRSGHGWRHLVVDEATINASETEYPGYLLMSAAPVIVCNHAREMQFTIDPGFARERIVTSAAAIIPGRKRPFGVLLVASHDERTFSRDDLHFLQAIGNVLGAAFERTVVDRELRREIALHEATLDAIAEGIFVTDGQQRVTRYNQRIIEMWRFPPELVATKDALKWVAYGSAQCEESDARAMDFMRASTGRTPDVITIRLKDGRVFERHSQPQIVDGSTVGRVWSYRDVTERVRAEEERRALESQMQHVQKLESLGVLAGGIAHDFNNLLVSMLGHAALAAADAPAGSPLHERINHIETAAQRAAELTNQMLAYSGRGAVVLKRSNLSAIVEEMANLLRTAIAKNAVLDLQLTPDIPAFDGDQTQIGQVVMNLITNASDAVGDTPGHIRIRTGVMDVTRAFLADAIVGADAPEGRYVFVEVQDDGCGMDKETLARIFEPFFTTKFTGRGLGLAAVLGIVRGHHGAIRIVSAPQIGTQFRVLLPAATTPMKEEAKPTTAPVITTGARLLVVDDEPGVRLVAREALKRAGFVVEVAEDGEDAIAIVKRSPDAFDAVLLDMTMPRLSGVDTLRALKEIRPGLPVVLTSGYSEQVATERIAPVDIAGFIQKPFRPAALVRTMHDAVSQGHVPETV